MNATYTPHFERDRVLHQSHGETYRVVKALPSGCTVMWPMGASRTLSTGAWMEKRE